MKKAAIGIVSGLALTLSHAASGTTCDARLRALPSGSVLVSGYTDAPRAVIARITTEAGYPLAQIALVIDPIQTFGAPKTPRYGSFADVVNFPVAPGEKFRVEYENLKGQTLCVTEMHLLPQVLVRDVLTGQASSIEADSEIGRSSGGILGSGSGPIVAP